MPKYSVKTLNSKIDFSTKNLDMKQFEQIQISSKHSKLTLPPKFVSSFSISLHKLSFFLSHAAVKKGRICGEIR